MHGLCLKFPHHRLELLFGYLLFRTFFHERIFVALARFCVGSPVGDSKNSGRSGGYDLVASVSSSSLLGVQVLLEEPRQSLVCLSMAGPQH